MKNTRVVVTGLGLIACNANDKNQFARALLNGESGIGTIRLFNSENMRCRIAGEVKMEIPEQTADNQDERMMFLAEHAIKQAMDDSRISKEYVSSLQERAGLSFSTSLIGNERFMNLTKEIKTGKELNPNWLTKNLACLYSIIQTTGINGPCYTTSTACAAGTGSVGVAFELIKKGRVDLMIAGGADPLTKFSFFGFHSLNSLSSENCKPFDEEHNGINIGEGSAFFIMENLEHAARRNAEIYAEILGYGINNDAYHLTSPDPEGTGAILSMKAALEEAGLQPEDVDYINAHGTATKANDEMELKAIARLFGNRADKLYISSTKSMTGHCLGAAGSLELAACIISLSEGFVPPTSSLKNPQKGYESFNLVRGKGVKVPLKYALSNSFAFAGNTASIVLSRFEKN